jgi:hypothetical protein
MRDALAVVFALAFLLPWVLAQYGNAPNNYYPSTYSGAIFTGTVSANKDDQVTLTFENKGQVETFVGRLDKNCSVSSKSGRGMTAADFPLGTEVTAFFNEETKKKGHGEKAKENVIIAVAFDSWNGQKITEDKKKIFWCTDNRQLQFKTW